MSERAGIIDTIRRYWRFDDAQVHTHSWHDREDFIREHLEPYVASLADAESDAYRRGVEEGIEAVKEQAPQEASEWHECSVVLGACDRALAALESETETEAK